MAITHLTYGRGLRTDSMGRVQELRLRRLRGQLPATTAELLEHPAWAGPGGRRRLNRDLESISAHKVGDRWMVAAS